MDDIRILITVGTVLFAGLSAWFAVKYGLGEVQKAVKALADRVDKIKTENEQQWKKFDGLNADVRELVVENKYLRRDLDELRSK